jgi:uncharacterized protein YqgC (DUF456 family)
MLPVILAIISVLLMVFALTSIILPVLPGGVPIAWLGLFIYSIGTGFERISVTAVIVFLILTLLTLALNFLSPMIGARGLKASKWGMWGAILGSFVGGLIWGLWGTVLGPYLGTVFGELTAGRRPSQSLRIGLGAVVGIIVGGLVNIVMVLTMLAVLIASWF